MNPTPHPTSQGQAVARRRRAMRRIGHWHQQALRGLLALERDPVAHMLLDQVAIRLQVLLSQDPAKAAPSSPAASTGG